VQFSYTPIQALYTSYKGDKNDWAVSPAAAAFLAPAANFCKDNENWVWVDKVFGYPGGLLQAWTQFSYTPIPASFTNYLGVAFEFSQGERRVCPSFFQINPSEFPQYVGLVQLLLHFQWNWVGLMAPEDDRGERFISSLMPMLQEKEICLAFIEMMKLDFLITITLKLLSIFKTWSKSEVIILFGDSNSIINVLAAMDEYKRKTRKSFCKVWILTCHWKVSMVVSRQFLRHLKFFHGSLHFRDHTRDVSEFRHYLLSLDPLNPQGDVFLPQ
ncbi:hypothetical protein E2320_022076, partial [Naja naja]